MAPVILLRHLKRCATPHGGQDVRQTQLSHSSTGTLNTCFYYHNQNGIVAILICAMGFNCQKMSIFEEYIRTYHLEVRRVPRSTCRGYFKIAQ